VQNPKYYLCPIDVESPTYTFNERNNELCSYVMNGSVCGFANASSSTSFQDARITDAWSPACYLLWEPDENGLGPGNPGAFEYSDGANYPSAPPYGGEVISRLHTALGGNLVCVDGSVQFLTFTAWDTLANTAAGAGPGPGGKTLVWWNPFGTSGH
jgi:hypothetical protein